MYREESSGLEPPEGWAVTDLHLFRTEVHMHVCMKERVRRNLRKISYLASQTHSQDVCTVM